MSRGASLRSLDLFDFDWSDEYLGQELLELAGHPQTTQHATSKVTTLLKLRKESNFESVSDALPIIEISISTRKPYEDDNHDEGTSEYYE